MKLDDLVYLAKAGYNKEEITALLKDEPAAPDTPAAPAAPDTPAAPAAPATPGMSEVDFLRKQVQDLQALNLMFASGKTPAQPESEQDIMRLLMNGKE